jgi:hypothetical protein
MPELTNEMAIRPNLASVREQVNRVKSNLLAIGDSLENREAISSRRD